MYDLYILRQGAGLNLPNHGLDVRAGEMRLQGGGILICFANDELLGAARLVSLATVDSVPKRAGLALLGVGGARGEEAEELKGGGGTLGCERVRLGRGSRTGGEGDRTGQGRVEGGAKITGTSWFRTRSVWPFLGVMMATRSIWSVPMARGLEVFCCGGGGGDGAKRLAEMAACRRDDGDLGVV